MCWTKNWTDHNGKHIPQSQVSLDEAKRLSLLRRSRGRRASQYAIHRDQVRKWELEIVDDENNLLWQRDANTRFYYAISAAPIGAVDGHATSVTKVQWSKSGGAVHGHPISHEQLMRELKAHNPARYEQEKARGDQ